MQAIMDYLNGTLPAEEFLALARSNKEIPQFFQSLIPEGADVIDQPYIPFHMENGKHISQNAASRHPFWEKTGYYNFFNCLEDRIDFEELFQKTNAFDTPGSRLNFHRFLYNLVKKVIPDLQYSERYRNEYGFYLDVCGETYDSHETRRFIDKLIYAYFSMPISLTKRRKLAKEALRVAFHVEGNKRPYWINGSQWPMGQNTPMKYLSTQKDGERRIYKFQDVDTGEIRLIEDWF